MTPIEQHLQTHAAALRALASALVGAQDADDLVQDTAVHALTAPPRQPGPLGGWLAQVLRHLASKHRRGERRRRLREASSTEPTNLLPPDAQAQTRETFQRLNEAVLALPEPYQDMLLRRYLREQSPATIAAETGVPLATVKSRLQRGLDLLRARFDRDGSDWRGAIVATLGLRPSATVATGITTGAMLMTGNSLKFAAAAAAVLVTAVTIATLASDPDQTAADAAPTVVAVTSPVEPAASPAPGATAAVAGERTVIPPPQPPELATVRGRVVDEHGRPRQGIPVALFGRAPHAPFEVERDSKPGPATKWSNPAPLGTPANGTFEFRVLAPVDFIVQISVGQPDEAHLRTRWHALAPGGSLDLGELALPTPGRVQGRIVATDGRGQPDLGVSLALASQDEDAPTTLSPRHSSARSDGNGEFTVPSLPPGAYAIAVDGRRLRDHVGLDLTPGAAARVELVVLLPDEKQTISGRVVDDQGRPLRGVTLRGVTAYGSDCTGHTDREGAFAIERPERALTTPVALRLEADGHEVLVTEPIAWGSKDLVFTLRGGLMVEVTTTAPDGQGTAFTAQLAELPVGQFAEHRTFDSWTDRQVTPPASVARFGPLARGRYAVRVSAPGSEFASATVAVEVRDPGPVRVVLPLPRSAQSTLRVVDRAGKPIAGSLVELIDPLGQRVDLDTKTLPRARWSDHAGDLRRVELLQAGRTDEAGELRLRGPARTDLALRLRGERQQFFAVQPFAMVEGAHAEVIAPPGASLTVRVKPIEVVRQWRLEPGAVASDGVPPYRRSPGLKVWRARPGMMESVPGQYDAPESFDDDGVCVLRGLPPGIWNPTLTLPLQNGARSLMLDPVTLAEGEARDLTLEFAHLLESELRGRLSLNGTPLPGGQVSGSIEFGGRRDTRQRLSDTGISDADGRFTLRLPQGLAKLSVSGPWPGSKEWISVDWPAQVSTSAGGVTEHTIDLRMGRVRCTFRDRHGKPVPGLLAQWFGPSHVWSEASDSAGRTPWLARVAGRWHLAAVPQRLLEDGARRRFEAAHPGDADPFRRVLVDLTDIEVTAAADRVIDVVVPDERFQSRGMTLGSAQRGRRLCQRANLPMNPPIVAAAEVAAV